MKVTERWGAVGCRVDIFPSSIVHIWLLITELITINAQIKFVSSQVQLNFKRSLLTHRTGLDTLLPEPINNFVKNTHNFLIKNNTKDLQETNLYSKNFLFLKPK